MEWMILPLRRYVDFRGRSRRKEFWMFVLFTMIVSVILSILDSMLGLGGSAGSFTNRSANGFAAGAGTSGGVLSGLFSLAIIVPSIAVSVRRLHDIDRTGWWLAIVYGLLIVGVGVLAGAAWIATNQGTVTGGALLAPVLVGLGGIGMIVLFVWACLDGTRGPNRFGPDPKSAMPDLAETFR